MIIAQLDAARLTRARTTMDELIPPPPPPSPFPDGDRRARRTAVTRAVRAVKAQHAAHRTLFETLADGLTRIASSTAFFVTHALWFGGWIAWNSGLLGWAPFDPFPFGLLTMVVSLEAIFLSIFVLMTQNRESAIAELREEMMLQVNLRMEEEVTKTLQLVAGLYTRLGHRMGDDDDLREMLQPLDAERIERELLEQIRSPAERRRWLEEVRRRQRKAAREGGGTGPLSA